MLENTKIVMNKPTNIVRSIVPTFPKKCEYRTNEKEREKEKGEREHEKHEEVEVNAEQVLQLSSVIVVTEHEKWPCGYPRRTFLFYVEFHENHRSTSSHRFVSFAMKGSLPSLSLIAIRFRVVSKI